MRILLSLVSLLSLATANPVSRNPSNHDGEYTWECGKKAPYNSLDCSKLLHWMKDTSKTGWFGIGKADHLTQYWDSCQIYIMTGPLGHFALEIQQDEFVDVINRGMTRECQDDWTRVMPNHGF
ncbi:hypothetical protein FVEG_15500 [Fusarium verticillioides 7600]|uniref:Ecp2 effector protein domain-containing protein n=1 Tax=Gibberella moniliformis (strain M3125 / FGSC 7600) TaxID=334819 RepID=W7M5L1_GIBM7|nr:hypothetical protein FVEG_15500 [Fusarium verticillioides 7600]EWG42835.1 hypothetical protein FVEG_15500 [Fusarium verticillioides 7600]